MTELKITDKNINVLYNCNYLNITTLIISAPQNIDLILSHLHKFENVNILYLNGNQLKEIKNLDKLINLKKLNLSNNEITCINGLENLINLEILCLGLNKITEINGLEKLVNLKVLSIYYNQIVEIKGLNKLDNLKFLNLSSNFINDIKELCNLVNLEQLYLGDNNITDLPLNLCNLTNIIIIRYYHNPIDHISLPVDRWLNRRITNNIIYNDKQNVHNHHIQKTFQNSLNNILKDKPLIDLQTVKQEIINNEILTEQTKREILNYCDDPTEHLTYLITYSDLLIYVWNRINNNIEILKVLNQEISDGLCMCFTGRLTRLLNTLTGFYNDIELQISNNEQITNIIMSLKNNINNVDELKKAVKNELIDRQYDNSIIDEWLEYI
jgi:Leucine-rich repeat (LRR) protein